MNELKAALRRIRGTRAFLPMAIGLGAAVLILLFAGGVAIYQNSTGNTKFIKKGNSAETQVTTSNGIAYNEGGKTGTLYKVDGTAEEDQVPYGSNEVLESGYDTKNLNTGTASKLQELQDQIDYMNENQQSSTTAAVENSMRGKVDYDTLNKAVSDSTDSLNSALKDYQKNATADSQAIRNTIASNKNDTDAKIKALENQIKNSSSSESTLASTVKDNYTTTTKKISDLETQTNKKISEVEKSTSTKISDLSSSVQKQIEDVKTAVGTDVTDKINTINNNITNIQSGSTAVLIGTYDSSTNTFTVKGGN